MNTNLGPTAKLHISLFLRYNLYPTVVTENFWTITYWSITCFACSGHRYRELHRSPRTIYGEWLMLLLVSCKRCVNGLKLVFGWTFWGFFSHDVKHFLKKILWRTWVLFVGPLISLFWTSGDVSSEFQSQSGFCLIRAKQSRMCYVTHSLRFTSGVTPTDLLVASMAAQPSLPHTWEALVGLKTGSYHAATHSVRSGRCSTDWAIPAQPYVKHIIIWGWN